MDEASSSDTETRKRASRIGSIGLFLNLGAAGTGNGDSKRGNCFVEERWMVLCGVNGMGCGGFARNSKKC